MRYSAQGNCLLCRKWVANVDRTSQVRRGNRSSGAPLLIRAVNLMNRHFEEVGDGR
jgi:hypothetical protein